MAEAQNRFSAETVGAAAAMPQPQSVASAPPTWKCDARGSEATGNFCQSCGAPKTTPKPVGPSRLCVCGAKNTGKFCNECGTKQFTVKDIVCSECSWTAEPGDEFTGYCPSCDHKFGPEDLDR
jgi:ribosomal protein L37E